MKITPEKQIFEDNIWHVLNEIQKGSRLVNSLSRSKDISYVIPRVRKSGQPSLIEEMGIITYLSEQNVIQILEGPKNINLEDEFTGVVSSGGVSFIIQKTKDFDNFFKTYEEKYTDRSPQQKLILSETSGEIIYKTTNSLYKAVFKKDENSGRLLLFLIKHPHKKFTAIELNEELTEVRKANAEDADPERRVRDTIKFIRNRLGLTKNPNNDNLFIVDNKSFGINCDTEIRQ